MSLPTLFVSHGAPTLALDPGPTGAALAAFAAGLPRPQATLVVSAHWETRQPTLGGTARPATIHDFGGFPRELYALDYPAAGAPALAQRAASLIAAAGLETALDPQRGLDHGAWVPLRLMFPSADIPVTQLSLQPRLGPAHHHTLGRALAPLRDEGVLLVGSGSMTHNLHEFGLAPRESAAFDYVAQFQGWFAERLAEADIDALLDYRRRAPHAARAHPSEEHLLPLFVALGAAGERPPATRLHDGAEHGMLAMDAYAFGG